MAKLPKILARLAGCVLAALLAGGVYAEAHRVRGQA